MIATEGGPSLGNWRLVVRQKDGAALSQRVGAGPWPDTQSDLILGVFVRNVDSHRWCFSERKWPLGSGKSLQSCFAHEEFAFIQSAALQIGDRTSSNHANNSVEDSVLGAERRMETVILWDAKRTDDLSFASNTSLPSLQHKLGTTKPLAVTSGSAQEESDRSRQALKEQQNADELHANPQNGETGDSREHAWPSDSLTLSVDRDDAVPRKDFDRLKQQFNRLKRKCDGMDRCNIENKKKMRSMDVSLQSLESSHCPGGFCVGMTVYRTLQF